MYSPERITLPNGMLVVAEYERTIYSPDLPTKPALATLQSVAPVAMLKAVLRTLPKTKKVGPAYIELVHMRYYAKDQFGHERDLQELNDTVISDRHNRPLLRVEGGSFFQSGGIDAIRQVLQYFKIDEDSLKELRASIPERLYSYYFRIHL